MTGFNFTSEISCTIGGAHNSDQSYFMQLWTCVAQQQQQQHQPLPYNASRHRPHHSAALDDRFTGSIPCRGCMSVFIGQPQPQPQASTLATANIARVVSPAPQNGPACARPSSAFAALRLLEHDHGPTGTMRGGLCQARGRVSGNDAIPCNGISFDGGTTHHCAGVDVEDDRHCASIDDRDNHHRHNGGGMSDGCGDKGGSGECDDDEIMHVPAHNTKPRGNLSTPETPTRTLEDGVTQANHYVLSLRK
ncbi:hypothetical protein EDB85DRAFT_1894322 [Lactarius pseudohatsudake]|nr:hypothetical protein EDB85DRAFT_1894322 [Lactarius pseudohatsudake]